MKTETLDFFKCEPETFKIELETFRVTSAVRSDEVNRAKIGVTKVYNNGRNFMYSIHMYMNILFISITDKRNCSPGAQTFVINAPVLNLQIVYWLRCQCVFSGGIGICNYSVCPHNVLHRQRQFEVINR